MEKNELFLKTAFCCMACDGEIAKQEVALIKKMATNESVFQGLNVQEKLNEYIAEINKRGLQFLSDYIDEVKNEELNDDSALQLIKVAIQTIEIDKQIKYSEISFFKRIRKNLSISDEAVLTAMPNIEDYLLPDIEKDVITYDWNVKFDTIQLNCPEF